MNNRLIAQIIVLTYILVSVLFLQNGVNAQTYGTLPMGGAGFVSGIVCSRTEANLIYLRTDVGGAYRWYEDKAEWIPLNDWVSSSETGFLGVESIALDPNNSDKLYMSVGIDYFNGGKSAILISSDRGNTFSKVEVTNLFKIHGNGMGRNTGEKLVVDPNLSSVLYYGSRAAGLFKSTNSGLNWSRLTSPSITTTPSGNGFSFVVLDPNSSIVGTETQTIIAGVCRTGENLYRSNDGGLSFTAITGAPTTLMPQRAVLTNDSALYITYADKEGPWNPTVGQIWKYNLSEQTWTNISPSGYNLPFCGISVDPQNPKRLVCATINVYRNQGNSQWGDVIFLSNDGGLTWTNKITSGFKMDPNGVEFAKSGLSIHWAGSIEFDPFNTKRVYVNSGNGLFRTDDIDPAVNTWKFDVNGLEESVPMDMVSIPGGPVVSVIGDYDGFRYTDISKYGKRLNPSMGTTVGIAYASLNPAVVVRAGSSIYYSEDTAKTWKLAKINGKQGYLSVSADGKTIIHSPGEEITTTSYKSVDKGNTWTAISGFTTKNARVVADPVNSQVFYSYNSSTGSMWVSTNGGNSFSSSGVPGTGGSKHIRTVPGFEGHLWVAMYNGGLQRSVDYGSKYIKLPGVTSCTAVGIGKAIGSSGYPAIYIWGVVSGVEGVYFSTNEGVSWNRINDNDHEWGGPGNGQFVIGDMNQEGIVYISTAGRGIVWAKADYMISADSVRIPIGGTSQIEITVLNSDTVKWTYSSSNPQFASVDTTGLVTGVEYGTSIITALSETGKSLKLSVSVTKDAESLTISPITDTINIGSELQLSAEILPADATNTSVTWSSLNPSVASISSGGLIKATKTGNTVINAVIGTSLRVSMPLFVNVPVTGLQMNVSKDTIVVSEELQLQCTFIPANAVNQSLTWKSGNSAIATVDNNGLVLGLEPGTAVITAKSVDGAFEANCEIEVLEFPLYINNQGIESGDFTVFPNPIAGSELSFDLGKYYGKSRISIFDSKGTLVIDGIESVKQKFIVTTNLNQGFYLVRCEKEGKTLYKKIIVK